MPEQRQRIILFEGLGTRFWRIVRATCYVGLSAAGVLSLFLSPSTLGAALQYTIVVWSVFLIVGGIFCAAGHFFKVLLLERAGLPLLISSIGVYGAAALSQSKGAIGPMIVGLILLSFAIGLLARAREVHVDSKVLKLLHTKEREGRANH